MPRVTGQRPSVPDNPRKGAGFVANPAQPVPLPGPGVLQRMTGPGVLAKEAAE